MINLRYIAQPQSQDTGTRLFDRRTSLNCSVRPVSRLQLTPEMRTTSYKAQFRLQDYSRLQDYQSIVRYTTRADLYQIIERQAILHYKLG